MRWLKIYFCHNVMERTQESCGQFKYIHDVLSTCNRTIKLTTVIIGSPMTTVATVAELVKVPYQWSEDHGFESWLTLPQWGPWASPFPLLLHTKEVKTCAVKTVKQFCVPIEKSGCMLHEELRWNQEWIGQWSGVNCAVDRGVSPDVNYSPAPSPLYSA